MSPSPSRTGCSVVRKVWDGIEANPPSACLCAIKAGMLQERRWASAEYRVLDESQFMVAEMVVL
jgi:hypothetical protein